MSYQLQRRAEAAELEQLGRDLGDVPHWTEGVHALLDNIVAIADAPAGRLPVLRRGARAEIPQLTRKLVLRRDNHHCRRCGDGLFLQLDHVVPWSQFGSDCSDNLQTLCDLCNNARSNFLEADHPRRVLGVVAVCDPCLHAHDLDMSRLHDKSGLWFGCPACRIWGEEWEGDERVPAYCGTCDYTSWVSDGRRIL